jgi:hypothetical protein
MLGGRDHADGRAANLTPAQDATAGRQVTSLIRNEGWGTEGDPEPSRVT